jgi:riboflavin synthase
MFTGITETLGTVTHLEYKADNLILNVASSLASQLRADQSVLHNGVCLTVTDCDHESHRVTAVQETLQKTTLGNLRQGDRVNLERSLTLQDRLDGHLVQGHVDATGRCLHKVEREGSWEFRIQFSPEFAYLVIEKGSIALNGISLTVFDVHRDAFSVAIIPHTLALTTMQWLEPGDLVNLEFDVIGKYVARLQEAFDIPPRQVI